MTIKTSVIAADGAIAPCQYGIPARSVKISLGPVPISALSSHGCAYENATAPARPPASVNKASR